MKNLSLKLWLTIFWITKGIDWGIECYLGLSKHRWLRMAKGYINTVSLSLAKVSLLRVLDTDATRLRYCWKFNKRLRAKDVHGRLFQHISISKNKQTGMVFTSFSVNDIESCWKRSRPVLRYDPPSLSSPSTPTPSLVSSGCRNRASACKFSWCHLALRPPRLADGTAAETTSASSGDV